MDGANYVALVNLYDRDGSVLARTGESCSRVNPVSLSWLLEQGHIQEKPSEEEES